MPPHTHRQRPAVVAAVGGGISAQTARHREAVVQAAEVAVSFVAASAQEAEGKGSPALAVERGSPAPSRTEAHEVTAETQQGAAEDGDEPTAHEEAAAPKGSPTYSDIPVSVVSLAAAAAARGIVGALIGPIRESEGNDQLLAQEAGMGDLSGRRQLESGWVSVGHPEVSLSERLEMEGLVSAYISASRRPKGLRDANLCDSIAARLDGAVRRLAEAFRGHRSGEGTPPRLASQGFKGIMAIGTVGVEEQVGGAIYDGRIRVKQPASLAAKESPCILSRLLSRPELTFDEAVCNASRSVSGWLVVWLVGWLVG